MPVIEKSSGHSNGEPAGETVKEFQPAKLKQGEPLLPQQPVNQVIVTLKHLTDDLGNALYNPASLYLTSRPKHCEVRLWAVLPVVNMVSRVLRDNR